MGLAVNPQKFTKIISSLIINNVVDVVRMFMALKSENVSVAALIMGNVLPITKNKNIVIPTKVNPREWIELIKNLLQIKILLQIIYKTGMTQTHQIVGSSKYKK